MSEDFIVVVGCGILNAKKMDIFVGQHADMRNEEGYRGVVCG